MLSPELVGGAKIGPVLAGLISADPFELAAIGLNTLFSEATGALKNTPVPVAAAGPESLVGAFKLSNDFIIPVPKPVAPLNMPFGALLIDSFAKPKLLPNTLPFSF